MATILKQGSKGNLVTILQKFLNMKGKLPKPIPEDGDFGTDTRDAVAFFQKKNGLPADGAVGAETAGALAKLIGPSSASFAKAFGATDSGKESNEPKYTIVLKGKTYQVSKQEYEESRRHLLGELKRTVVVGCIQRANAARVLWNHFNDLNKEQYIVSFFIGARFFLPKENIIKEAEDACDRLKNAVEKGDFGLVRDALRTAAGPINTAYEEMMTYQQTTCEVAGDTKERLEFVRDTSFTIVEAYATVQLGGTPAAGALATGVGEFVKSSTGELSKYAIGISPGAQGAFTNIALDTLGGAASGFVAGLMPFISKYIGGKLAGKWISQTVAEKVVGKTLEGAAKGALKKAIETTIKLLKSNAKMTKTEFAQKVAEEMWQGFKWGAAGGAFDSWFQTKFANAVYEKMGASQAAKYFGDIKKDEAIKLLQKLIAAAGATPAKKAVEAAFADSDGTASADAIGSAAAEKFVKTGLPGLQGEIAKQVKAR